MATSARGILSIMKLSKLSGGGRSPFDRRARERSPSAPAAVQSGWLLHGIPAYTAATLIIRVHFNVNKLLNPHRDTRVPLPTRSPAPNVTYSLILDIVPNLRTSSPNPGLYPENTSRKPPTLFLHCVYIVVGYVFCMYTYSCVHDDVCGLCANKTNN